MTGCTLEELSTRESEMSVQETSFMVMQRSKTNSAMGDSNMSVQSSTDNKPSGFFSSFFQSLIKPASPDDADIDPGADSDEEASVATTARSTFMSKGGAKGDYHQ